MPFSLSDPSSELSEGDELNATVSRVALRDRPWGQCFEFKFVGGDGLVLYGETPTQATSAPDNKFRIWAERLLRAELPLGSMVGSDQLERRTCRVVVGVRCIGDRRRVFVRDVLAAV